MKLIKKHLEQKSVKKQQKHLNGIMKEFILLLALMIQLKTICKKLIWFSKCLEYRC